MTVIWLLWCGGVAPAYAIERGFGRSPISAALEALFWPWQMGRYLARNFYESDAPNAPDQSVRRENQEKTNG